MPLKKSNPQAQPTWQLRVTHCYFTRLNHFFIFYYFILGLTKKTSDEVTFSHVTAMADFAFRLKDALKEVNEHSFNNFKLRAGSY